MCFAPQWYVLFRHLNLQKWSEHLVLLAFWLGNVLRATTACNFSSLIWPDGSAPAALASHCSTLQSHKSLGKNSKSQLSYLFAQLRLPSSLSFSSLIFSLLFFSSLTLPTFAFPSVHIVGSLTSKLPSMIYVYIFEILAPLLNSLWWALNMKLPNTVYQNNIRWGWIYPYQVKRITSAIQNTFKDKPEFVKMWHPKTNAQQIKPTIRQSGDKAKNSSPSAPRTRHVRQGWRPCADKTARSAACCSHPGGLFQTVRWLILYHR